MAYKHGIYGSINPSTVAAADNSATVAAYVGTLPVNLIPGYKEAGLVNNPIELTSFSQAQKKVGYSDDWDKFTLCEAIAEHFNNTVQNIGPIYVINVLDPDTAKSTATKELSITTVNGTYSFKSDDIILDTFAIAEKTKDKDFTVSYSFATGMVTVKSLTGELSAAQASYYTVDASKVTKAEVIGETTADGQYKGMDALKLLYQRHNVVLNLLGCPKYSEDPDVYMSMVAHVQNLNGHWDGFVMADIPVKDATGAIDTIDKAIAWKEKHGYNSEYSKVCWPQFVDGAGKVHHLSVACLATALAVDTENDDVPFESPSNRKINAVDQYFGADSKNNGFDQEDGNQLNEKGITTLAYIGGAYKLWGPHTAAYSYGGQFDPRVTFDSYIRTLEYIVNDFQLSFGDKIDHAMTPGDKDAVLTAEQSKLDALKAMGALVGTPVVAFNAIDNSTSDLMEGNFTWATQVTNVPLLKSATNTVAYNSDGLKDYLVQE